MIIHHWYIYKIQQSVSLFVVKGAGDPIALLLPGRPVQLSASESFAEEPYHSDLAISYHVEVTTE